MSGRHRACASSHYWSRIRGQEQAAVADLEMCGIDWLWPSRFAKGKFGLIAGLPDMGKGQIAAFIAAAVTAALELPCDEGSAAQSNIIWFNAEDGLRRARRSRGQGQQALHQGQEQSCARHQGAA